MARANNSPVDLDVRGLIEAQRKMEQVTRDLRGQAFVDGMHKATLLVTRDARINAPVDNGLLRASIVPEVRQHGLETEGVVGSNKEYAPYQELGTGIFVGRSPYFPPPSALETWARRHGTTGYVVARAIFMRGGLKPKRFLQRALEDNREAIVKLLGNVVGKIARK